MGGLARLCSDDNRFGHYRGHQLGVTATPTRMAPTVEVVHVRAPRSLRHETTICEPTSRTTVPAACIGRRKSRANSMVTDAGRQRGELVGRQSVLDGHARAVLPRSKPEGKSWRALRYDRGREWAQCAPEAG
jgi:hypothetical protein